jgi:hypothetical protein
LGSDVECGIRIKGEGPVAWSFCESENRRVL